VHFPEILGNLVLQGCAKMEATAQERRQNVYVLQDGQEITVKLNQGGTFARVHIAIVTIMASVMDLLVTAFVAQVTMERHVKSL